MAQIYTYPTANQLRQVDQVMMPRLQEARPIFQLVPIVELDTPILQWEQKDNYVGLQQLRGLDGQPQRVIATGGKKYTLIPGVYGEFEPITEEELTIRRQYGDESRPIDLSDLVREKQDKLMQRRLDRIEQIGWDILQGRFSVANGNGLTHTDQYPVQKATATVAWGTSLTAVPIKDFQGVQLLEEGRSSKFGSAARAFMNRRTWNKLINNTNPNDLGGRRTTGALNVITAMGVGDVNKVMTELDLPQINIYHGGYYTDASVWTPFIPNDKVLIIADRPGANIAEYVMTRNATNPGVKPGAYTLVWDSAQADGGRPPRRIEVHDGHNGGPAIYFPGDVVVLSV